MLPAEFEQTFGGGHSLLLSCSARFARIMMKRTIKRSAPLPPFENGQVWQMQDTSVRIGLVGKRLVHFKHYSTAVKRPSTQLTGKERLEQFLRENDAVLV